MKRRRKGNMDEYNYNWIKHMQMEHPEWDAHRIARKRAGVMLRLAE